MRRWILYRSLRGMRKLWAIRSRLLVIAAALNITGIVFGCAALQIRQSTGPRASVIGVEGADLLEYACFALMLPGIFFAAVILLFARWWGWSEGTTCGVWYAVAMAINIAAARKSSATLAECAASGGAQHQIPQCKI